VSSYLLGCNFILAAAKIADGSIPTNHNKFSMASARYKVNHAVSKRLLTFFLAMIKASSSLVFEVREIQSRCQEGGSISLESIINITSIIRYHDRN
jgi:hypothetical protein